MIIQTNRVRSISPVVLVGLAVSMLSGCAGHHASNPRQPGNNTQVSMAAMDPQAVAWASSKITANCVTKPTDIEVSLPDGTKETATVDRYAPQIPYVNAEVRLLTGSAILELIEGAARMERSRIVRIKPKRVTLGQNAGIMDITATADRSNGNQYLVLEKDHGGNAVLEVILSSTQAAVTLSENGEYAEIKTVNGVDTITKGSLTFLAPNDALLQTINRLRAAMQ